jgi:hypothetical protein
LGLKATPALLSEFRDRNQLDFTRQIPQIRLVVNLWVFTTYRKKRRVFYSSEVQSEFGTPASLHSIPHHNVEQVVVEDDTLTGTGILDVKDQIRNAVVRQSRGFRGRVE